MNTTRYRGDGLPPDRDPQRRHPYRADEHLARAVNMAIVLGRPLLVKGPPGCGKTRLAESVAHELGLPLYPWYVKSTARARDGLYRIDTLRRLQDAQVERDKAQRLTNYLTFGELGEALRRGVEAVVLIDEIDKADLDFPNDLLQELERGEFTIQELVGVTLTPEETAAGYRVTYKAGVKPVIVITSNDEKELPDAFLRRCLFHYIDFPDEKRLIEIVQANAKELGLEKLEDALVQAAARRLLELRDKVEGLRKQPSTSELIDWVRLLHHWGVSAKALAQAKTFEQIPHWERLFKNQQDLLAVQRAGGAKETE